MKDVEFTLTHGKVIESHDDYPLPSLLLNGRTSTNQPLHVVIGINMDERKLVVITTYEPNMCEWAENFSRRIV